jgi:nucleotide-binding universal stress UspA family protein
MAAKPIIAATDGSEVSLRAVEWAAREAVARNRPLQIVSIPALPPRMSPDPEGRETVAGILQQAAQQALASAAQRAAAAAPGLAASTALLPGAPTQALTEASHGASMLVAGSRGTGGFAALTLGSVSRYLATHAQCPVVIAGEQTMPAHREIVVGIHDPDRSAAALGFAFEEAALRQARLLAVHAWARSLPSTDALGTLTARERAVMDRSDVEAYAAERLETALAGWRDEYPAVEAVSQVVHAHPARMLIGASARADLVVLGRRAAGPGVGAITHPLLSHAHGPVAIVPGA